MWGLGGFWSPYLYLKFILSYSHHFLQLFPRLFLRESVRSILYSSNPLKLFHFISIPTAIKQNPTMKNFMCHQIKSALIKRKIKLNRKKHIFNQIIFSPSHYSRFFLTDALLRPSVAKSFLIEPKKIKIKTAHQKTDNIALLIDCARHSKVLWSTNEFQLKSWSKGKFNIRRHEERWLTARFCGFELFWEKCK